MAQSTFSLSIALLIVGLLISLTVIVEVALKQDSKATRSALKDLKEDITALKEEAAIQQEVYRSNPSRRAAMTARGGRLGSRSDSSKRVINRSLLSKGGVSGAKDCTELWRSGYSRSGVYTIHPNIRSQFEVLCDMDSGGGGWTVFQRRISGKLDFKQSWEDYVWGLGSPFSEQWLGLRNLYIMTYYQKQPSELRIDLWDKFGNHTYAQYNNFWVDSEEDSYRIHVSGYNENSTQSDIMQICNEMKFSTPDRDNDDSYSVNCAYHQQSGWWFNQCSFDTNLNAPYSKVLWPFSLLLPEENKLQLGNVLQRVEMKFRTPSQ